MYTNQSNLNACIDCSNGVSSEASTMSVISVPLRVNVSTTFPRALCDNSWHHLSLRVSTLDAVGGVGGVGAVGTLGGGGRLVLTVDAQPLVQVRLEVSADDRSSLLASFLHSSAISFVFHHRRAYAYVL